LKISIITPTYNSEQYIENNINSVFSQSYKNTEHIIVDGASTDNTIKLINKRKNNITFFVSEKDNGIYDAINKGISLSTGDIIGILNSDDKFHNEEVLKEIINVFIENPDVYCLYGNLIFLNNSKKLVRVWNSKKFVTGQFEKSWTPAHPTFYCRKSVYDLFGKYKIDYKIAADVEFMFRVLEIGKLKSFFLNKILVDMTIGGVSTRGFKSTITITKEIRKAFRENGYKLNLIKYLFFKLLKLKEFR
jgi:glycosyltransferase involved in cell wall biosynthesis